MYRAQCVLVIALLFGLAHSWDVAVSADDRIEFLTIDGNKTDIVHFNSQNLTALAYDEVHNMLLYVDKQSDKGGDVICGYKISFVEYQCYIERNGRSIQGLAFDPITETLFFTDTNERSINWLSFKSGSKNNVYGNLLIKLDQGIPTDIVVDSCRGYVYWINTDLTRSTIERARFDGSEREVVIIATNQWDLHSLAIDQQAQKIYWKRRENDFHIFIDSADFNGKNREALIEQVGHPDAIILLKFGHTNTLTVFKQFLLGVTTCINCGPRVIYKHPKPLQTYSYKDISVVQTISNIGTASKYKIRDQLQGISECSHVLNNYKFNNNPSKIAREYEGPFCVNGIRDNGQSLCKCKPGYTGARCDASVCENYCIQGTCSLTEEGLPKCRCNAGYSGERCEVNMCHGYCSNNGTCFLNEKEEPGCQCKIEYVGHRCEVSVCENYCFQGDCTFNEKGLPECRCNAGYSGKLCEVNVCNGYCLNNGTCSLNEEDVPVCECIGEYEGGRCEILIPASLHTVDGSLNKKVDLTYQTRGSGLNGDQNKAISSTSGYYAAGRNLTLADLLANWRKPVTIIYNYGVVEVKSNN